MIIPEHLLPADGRFGSGPSRIPAHRLHLDPAIMGTSHRMDPVKRLVGDVRHKISALFNLPDGYQVLLGNGGASLVWDAMGFCLVETQAQAAVMGEFSAKAARALTGHPLLSDPEVRQVAPGEAVTPEATEGIDTYVYPHNETSTGVMLDVTRVPGGLTVVDGTSAAGGVLVDPTETDFYYFSGQKNFAADGGLWLAFASPAAIDRIRALASTRWVPDMLNLGLALDQSQKNQTLNTPALATLTLINDQLTWMLESGGLPAMDTRTRDLSTRVYAWIEETDWAHGFAVATHRSQVVVTADIDLPANRVAEIARANNIFDIEGYRGLGRNQLRIATFPITPAADIEALLACLTWIGEHLPSGDQLH